MLASIHPLGERARGNRFGVTAAFYAVGSAAGGSTVGALAGAPGAIVRLLAGPKGVAAAGSSRPLVPVAVAGLAVAILLGAAGADEARRSAGWKGLWTLRRQVDDRWLTTYRGWVYGLGFGFQLGLGVATIVTTAAVYAWLLVVALAGSVTAGVVVGALFGLARALPVLAGARVHDGATLRRLHQRLHRWNGTAGRATTLTLALAAVVVAAVGFGGASA